MTDVSISNRSLQKLAAGKITALSDGTTLSDACGLIYADLRDSVMVEANWNFALKRVALTALGSTPAWGFASEFTLPADSLRILKIERMREDDWSVENGKILTVSTTTSNVLYIYQNTDTTTYPQMFIEALSARMAWELTEHLVQSRTKKADLRDEYIAIMRQAMRINKLEGVPNRQANGSWLDSRV